MKPDLTIVGAGLTGLTAETGITAAQLAIQQLSETRRFVNSLAESTR